MKEFFFLLKLKNIFTPKRRRYSGLLSMSFILMILTLFFSQCDTDDYTGEIESICPEVITTDPVNGATNVLTNKVITATFNEPMLSTSINESTFFVKNGANRVSGQVTYSGSTATFTPASLLEANTVYTATVTRGAADLMGNVLRNDTTWSFNTGVSPGVILTDPVEGASDVALDKAVTADFSTAMNAATVNATSFLLKQGTTAVAGVVTYLGVKATFTPTLDLLPNKVYTATITNSVEDVAGNAMRNDTTWSFSTGSLLFVTVTDPLDGAIDVPSEKIVKATFNKIMNPATINNSTFTLMHGTTPVAGTVSYSEYTAEFAPLVNLLPGEEYTATITTGAIDLTGNSLASDYTWTFTTNVSVLPVVITTDPIDEAVDVALNKVVRGTFNKLMSPATINNSTFTLMHETTPVAGTVSYSGYTAEFAPLVNLLPGEEYTATITTGAMDLTGNSLASDYTWTFTTNVIVSPVLPVVVTTDPIDGAIDVELNKVITATFSKTMDLSTINSSTFTLTNGLIPVLGFINYSGVDGTFTPNSPLLPGTVYTATITTGAKDLEGNALAENYVWNFTTSAALPQFIVALSSSPLTGGTTSGGGLFNSGASVTALAVPNAGYSFIDWTENGLRVSTSENYTFVVNTNRTLVANFALSGPAGINLRSAGDFAILAGAGITNTGGTLITGDVGSHPTATIVGLTNANVIGTLYTVADPIVGTAKTDLTTAFNDAQSRTVNAISLPGQLGGLTLAPGLYVNSSTTGISGTGPNGILTLDAGGNPNAVWIFKMGSTLITDAGTSIVLAGGAQAENIYWSVGTSATLGTNSMFYGNILADQAITIATGATLTGRALTRVAAVSLDTNTVTKP